MPKELKLVKGLLQLKDYIGQGSGVTQRKCLAPSSGGFVHMRVCVHAHVAVMSVCVAILGEGGGVAYLRLSFRLFFSFKGGTAEDTALLWSLERHSSLFLDGPLKNEACNCLALLHLSFTSFSNP